MSSKDYVQLIFRDHILNDIMPVIFPKYNKILMDKYKAYMIIIGGISVQKCAELDRNAKRMLRNIFSEDIDIKVVMLNHRYAEEIHKVRLSFVEEITDRLRLFILKNSDKWDASLKLSVKIDDSLIDHPVDIVRKARVIGITLDYVESKWHSENPIVDTSVFSRQTVPHFDKFMKMTGKDVPVPYYINKGVWYATCQYSYYDTVRMLVDRAAYLKEKKSMFALMKFFRYVVKFMALYVMRKKMTDLPPRLKDIYIDVYKKLRKIDFVRVKKGFKEMHHIKYNEEYVERIVGTLNKVVRASEVDDMLRAVKKSATS